MHETLKRLTRVEAAQFLGCGLTKLYELVKSGALDGTYYKIGNRLLFIAQKLEDWMLEGGEKKYLSD